MKKHKAAASAEPTLKPIETVYRGHKMRSRLEARWAVFMDCLGIEWEYEKEGYDLDGVWYLPDFWLPKQDMWMEVKGQATGNWVEKAERLATHSGKYVAVFIGSCSLPEEDWDEHGNHANAAAVHDTKRWISSTQNPPVLEYGWCHCCNCGAAGVAYETGCRCPSKQYTTDHHFRSPLLMAAYAIVRGIRFDDAAFVAALTADSLSREARCLAATLVQELFRSPSAEAYVRAEAIRGLEDINYWPAWLPHKFEEPGWDK